MNGLAVALALMVTGTMAAQTVNAMQQVSVEGLRTNAGYGNFVAASYGRNGDLYLLLDEHDGVRVLESDPNGLTILAQIHFGTIGDVGTAMSIDPAGNVLITGTTTSGSLAGTSGSAFPSVVDSSTNSFVAKYDANLNPIFLSFLGSGRTVSTSITATADGVFVTGSTFSTSFPVTTASIEQVPASGSSENGFVERFSADGTTLEYATYLTGANGDTMPAAIAADALDNAYIAGTTSASGFPTLSALQSELLWTSGVSTSGFLTKLDASGSSFVYSTFIAGSGITGMVLDSSTQSLLLSGSIALGQFPVSTVAMPLVDTSYQTFLRLTLDGQSVKQSVLLTAGTTSSIASDGVGGAWISGAIDTPLFPGLVPPTFNAGDSYLMHVTPQNMVDQTLRFGGTPKNNVQYTSLSSSVGAPTVSGADVWLPGMLTATISSSLLTTQTFEFPMTAPTTLLPNALHDALPDASSCGTSSLCSGTAGLLVHVSKASAAVSLTISSDDFPNLTVRNLGSAPASSLTVTTSGYASTSDCGSILPTSAICSIALAGNTSGIMSVSAQSTPADSISLPPTTLTADPLVINQDELDFGIVSATSGSATQTLLVTNLSQQPQAFTSVMDGVTNRIAYSLTETSSTCTVNGSGAHQLAAGSSCTITLSLTPSSSSHNDGPIRTAWKVGTRDVIVTAFTQARALSLSASEVDFGAYIAGGILLPRYLYLSNNSNEAIAHGSVKLPQTSPFAAIDNCPDMLPPKSVCQIQLQYQPLNNTESDTTTLSLDNGLSVLLTGEALPAPTINGATRNPSLNVSATTLSFATGVIVTGISTVSLPLTITNTGTTTFPLELFIVGDFTYFNGCPGTLSGGASCSLSISFAPSQAGPRQGLLSVSTGGYAPLYVSLNATGSALLPPNNGVLSLGQTLAGEPLVTWYKVQQSLPTLTAVVGNTSFGVAIVEDTGNGPGTLPTSNFASSATLACSNCWLGVQYLSQTAQMATTSLTLTSVPNGKPYLLMATATSQPLQGLVLTPQISEFGTEMVGSTSGSVTFTLTNLLPSAEPALVESVTTTGDFTIVPNMSGGVSCTGLLDATASCFIEISFTPSLIGERSGTLTIATTAGTVTAELDGYGTAMNELRISPTSLAFDAVPGNISTTQNVTLTSGGESTVTVGTIAVSNPSFSASSNCSTLATGDSCSVTVDFIPQSALQSAILSIPITESINGQIVNSSYAVALAGNYTPQDEGLEILPQAVNFGAAFTGTEGGTREFVLNNLTSKPLSIALQMAREFPLASNSPCTTVAANSSCTFSVSFAPVETASLTGTVLAQGTSPDGSTTSQALVYLQGYGNGDSSLSIQGGTIPYSPLNFGQVTSGQRAQQVLTLVNSGNGPLTIHRISSAPPFLATTNCGVTLTANQSCGVTVTYAPIDELTTGSSTTGTRNDLATLTIESDAASSPDEVSMTGLVLPITSSSPASSAILATYSLSNSALTFANTQVGDESTPQMLTITNDGTTLLHLLGFLAPPDFLQSSTCGTLQPGDTCQISVTFAPTAASSALLRTGTLEIQSDATDALEYVTLVGSSTAAPLTLGQSSLNFGSINVGSSGTLSVSVTNNGAAPVTFLALNATGAFSVTAGTCPSIGATLAAGSTCTLVVSFAPAVSGAQSGTLSLSSDATQLPLTVALSGTATIAQLQVNPGALNYGSLAVGSSANMALTLTNVGSATLTGIAETIGGTNAADFSVTSPCAVTKLTAAASCTETVTLTPSTPGARTGSLTISSSDPDGPTVIQLSGSGVTSGTFTLTADGKSSATVTVSAGQPASYTLLVTPLNGYAGNVALTCSAVNAGPHASCFLLSPLLSINGGTAGTTATISTVSAATQASRVALAGLLLLLPFACLRRRKLRSGTPLLLLVLLALGLGMAGCGSGPGAGGSGTGSGSNTVTTPPGTYQYQVTASSTSGTVISSTVTLNLIIQ